jgi:dihydroflavonol-4-reductase
MILVTGGTGSVGFHLLLQLLEQNIPIRATYRSEKKLKKIAQLFSLFSNENGFKKIEWVKADILDIPKLQLAFENVTQVYHCAAMVSFDPKDEENLYQNNIIGTANVVNLCLASAEKGIPIKLCHVSSIAALGNGNENNWCVNEETDRNTEVIRSDYAISKFGAEMEVWRGYQEGLNVVIVNPGVILGNGFPKEGASKMIRMVKKGLSFYTKGNIGIVAIEDVVKSMILLMNSNISGERYIVVGEDITYKNLFTVIAKDLHKKAPKFELKPWLTSFFWQADWVMSNIFFMKRSITQSLAKSLHSPEFHDNSKLKKELDFSYQETTSTIENWVKFYAKNK